MRSKERYTELSRYETLPLFVNPKWLDAIIPSGRWDVVIAQEDGVIHGALPYQYKKKWGVKAITSPWMTPPQKLWIRNLPDHASRKGIAQYHKITESLLSNLESTPYHNFRIQAYPFGGHAWSWAGYTLYTKYTYILELRDLDSILSGMKATLRNEVQKSEKLFDIVKETDPGHFHHLLLDQVGYSYDLVSKKMLQNLFDLKENILPLVAYKKNKPVACTLFAFDRETIYYVLGARIEETENLGLTGLLWHIIKTYCDQGMSLDFEGSMIRGIENYFRGFGGCILPTLNPVKKAKWVSPFI